MGAGEAGDAAAAQFSCGRCPCLPGTVAYRGVTSDVVGMRIVFSSPPSYGHIYPFLPLALACADLGHDVVVATAEPFLDRLPLPTTRSMPAGTTMKQLRDLTLHNHPELPIGTVEGMYQFGGRMFGETLPRVVAPTLIEEFSRDKPDLVVYECCDIGAAVAADVLGVRAVAYGVGAATDMFRGWHRAAVADQASRWRGRQPGDLASFPIGYLDPVPASLYGTLPLPPNRIAVRATAWSEPARLPAVLAGRGRRRVYITLGTMSFGAVDVLRRAVLETAAHDVDVVVAAGPEGDPTLLGELPGNVHVARFLPQADVLSRVDLIVHHGGAGTVLGALEHGVPQLVLPQGADQPFNAELVAGAGAGRKLTNDEQVPGAIGAAVEALLAEGPERVRARGFAWEMAALPGPAEVAAGLG
jgi:Erythromycin biosynthesis protein CIII-like, C-terminal domain